MSEMAILFDSSKCTACKGCQVACKCWNNLPSPTELNACAGNFTGTYQNPPDINGDTRLIITFDERETDSQKGIAWAFGRRACQHCTNAGCVSVCPAGALYKDEETGMVAVDESKCIGCQRCSSACPYHVPQYHGPKGAINKCTGCVDRIQNGMEPACVATCQPNALQFGERSEMLKKAEERVEWLHEKGYKDAVVYGDTEMDGLHVIQVLKYGIEAHGQVENPAINPAAALTQIMKPVAAVGMGATVVGLAAMFGLAHGYKRDTLVYNEETKDTISMETGNVVKQGDPQDTRTFKEALTENLGKGAENE